MRIVFPRRTGSRRRNVVPTTSISPWSACRRHVGAPHRPSRRRPGRHQRPAALCPSRPPGLKGQVKSIADLKGRTIGLHSNSTATRAPRSGFWADVPARRRAAERLSHRQRRPALGIRGNDTQTGAVDAVIGDEPHASHMVADKIAFPHLVPSGDQGQRASLQALVPARSLIGRSGKIDKDKRKAETMVRIIRRTLAWIAAHSAEFADKLGVPIPTSGKN